MVQMTACGTPSRTAIADAGLCVGPMMKFPSASGGGTTPSGSSLAVTNPGVFGSRVGGVGRGTGEVVCGGGVVGGGFCEVVAAATASRLSTSAMRERVVVMIERRR